MWAIAKSVPMLRISGTRKGKPVCAQEVNTGGSFGLERKKRDSGLVVKKIQDPPGATVEIANPKAFINVNRPEG